MKSRYISLLCLICISAATVGCMKDADELLEQKAADEARVLGHSLVSEGEEEAKGEVSHTPVPETTPEPTPVATEEPVETPEPTPEPTVTPEPTPTPVPTPSPVPTPTPVPEKTFAGAPSDIPDFDVSIFDTPAPAAPVAPAGEVDVANQPEFSKLSVATLTFTDSIVYTNGNNTILRTVINNPNNGVVSATLQVGVFKEGRQVRVIDLFAGEIDALSTKTAFATFENANYASDQYEVKFLGRMKTLDPND